MVDDVVVVIGAGGIGVATARRQGFGKTILLADFNEKTLQAAAEVLKGASYNVATHHVDVSSRESVRSLVNAAAALGNVLQVVNTAGLSPNMAPPDRVMAFDLYGSAVVFEEFERVIAPGGAWLIISSMAGHMLPALTPEQDHALAFTPADELLDLPFVKSVPNSMVAYMMAKRANNLRV
jgi:NAD(P)-dependent dehydrogenase (short-subunit alcohol dehydrogenase family)